MKSRNKGKKEKEKGLHLVRACKAAKEKKKEIIIIRISSNCIN
jgi:hypothetical protein